MRTIFRFLHLRHALPVKGRVMSIKVRMDGRGGGGGMEHTSLESGAGTGCSRPFLGHYEFSRSRIVQRKS